MSLRSVLESVRKHPLLSCIQALTVPLVFLAFVYTVNFMAAVTPDDVIAKNLKPLPPGWSAGVMNGGEYMRWWPIREKPVLFVAGVSVFPTAMLINYWVQKKKRQSP